MKSRVSKTYGMVHVIIFLVPIMTIIVLLYFLIGWSVVLSLTKSVALTPTWKFIGLESYRKIMEHSRFWIAIRNNLIWLILLVAIANPLGLILAYLISLLKKRIGTVLRLLFLYPLAISFVVTGAIWAWMYSPETGVVNTLLHSLHLDSLAKPWLADPNLALYAVIGASVWQFAGFAVALYAAALTAIPLVMIESARVEGASGVQVFTRIIIPNLGHASLIVTSMLAMLSLKMIFPLVWVMTRGGPLNATEVLPHLMYITTFERVRMSMGAAVSVIIFLIAISIVLPYGYFSTRRWFK